MDKKLWELLFISAKEAIYETMAKELPDALDLFQEAMDEVIAEKGHCSPSDEFEIFWGFFQAAKEGLREVQEMKGEARLNRAVAEMDREHEKACIEILHNIKLIRDHDPEIADSLFELFEAVDEGGML